MSNHLTETTLPQLLTLIITTSPTPSAPSTALLSSVLESFRSHCIPLLTCRVIVVFDTYERITSMARLKKGCVTQKGAEDYNKYKQNCRDLFLQQYKKNTHYTNYTYSRSEAEYGSPNSTTPVSCTITSTEDSLVTFIDVVDRRLGFGLAVRTALRVVETPYAWVHQHDWALIQHVPISLLLGIMQAYNLDIERPIKYVCLPSSRRMTYATSDQVTPFPELRALSHLLTDNYSSPNDPSTTVPLTPMFFWHDKPHIASTAHYLQRVFPSRLAMSRGNFIEDTIGHVARNQMKEGQWAKWATWLYNPSSGTQHCLKHLHGRTWEG